MRAIHCSVRPERHRDQVTRGQLDSDAGRGERTFSQTGTMARLANSRWTVAGAACGVGRNRCSRSKFLGTSSGANTVGKMETIAQRRKRVPSIAVRWIGSGGRRGSGGPWRVR